MMQPAFPSTRMIWRWSSSVSATGGHWMGRGTATILATRYTTWSPCSIGKTYLFSSPDGEAKLSSLTFWDGTRQSWISSMNRRNLLYSSLTFILYERFVPDRRSWFINPTVAALTPSNRANLYRHSSTFLRSSSLFGLSSWLHWGHMESIHLTTKDVWKYFSLCSFQRLPYFMLSKYVLLFVLLFTVFVKLVANLFTMHMTVTGVHTKNSLPHTCGQGSDYDIAIVIIVGSLFISYKEISKSGPHEFHFCCDKSGPVLGGKHSSPLASILAIQEAYCQSSGATRAEGG